MGCDVIGDELWGAACCAPTLHENDHGSVLAIPRCVCGALTCSRVVESSSRSVETAVDPPSRLRLCATRCVLRDYLRDSRRTGNVHDYGSSRASHRNRWPGSGLLASHSQAFCSRTIGCVRHHAGSHSWNRRTHQDTIEWRSAWPNQTGITRRHSPLVQVRGCRTSQSPHVHSPTAGLAAQLLRTGRAQRGRTSPDQVVHHHESHPMESSQSSAYARTKRVGAQHAAPLQNCAPLPQPTYPPITDSTSR
jgi:hypothetical protein